MNTFFTISFLILSMLDLRAQDRKIKFSSVNQACLLSGDKGEKWMFQTINGIKKEKWFAGAGTGFDYYEERTIPLFLDVRRDFSNKKNTPFVYTDAGINFLYLNFIQREQKQFPTSSPGLFYDLGLGWKLSGKSNRAFILSAGYTFKQVKEKVKYSWWPAPTPQLEAENYQRFNYLYRRIVIKVGFAL